MRYAHRLSLWFKTLLHRQESDQRLDDEIRFHLDQQSAENIDAGMNPIEARQAAVRTIGNAAACKEQTRETWGWIWLEQLGQDLRYGFRILVRNPTFTLVAVLTLVIGIASTSVLFSIFDGAYIHFGETKQANRVVVLTQRSTNDKEPRWRFSAPEFFEIGGLHRSFDGFFATRLVNATLSENLDHPESPERVPVVRATANIFSLYGVSAMLGRTFTPDEDRPGGPNVAVVTYRLWNVRFARNPTIVGKTIKLDGVAYTVIGVAPRRFQHWGADIYLPFALDPAANNRSQRDLIVAGVPREGLSVEQVKPELDYLAHRVETQYGAGHPEYTGLIYEPFDVREGVLGDLRLALYILLSAVAMLALIASANIASLLLARARARAAEIGTRLALGAKPARLARQFLTESVLLSAIAGVLGCLVGLCSLKPILALIPAHYIGEETEIHASPIGFLVSLSVALFLGLLFGLGPALLISRRGVASNLRQSASRSVTDRRGGRMRAALVFVEMALAFVVVMGAGLMVRTYRQLTSMDLGFRPDHVLTMRIALPELRYAHGVEVTNFFRELLVRLRASTGIVDVAASSDRPMEDPSEHDFSIPGRALNAANGIARASYRVVTPSYFTVVRTSLRSGRLFTEQDTPQTLPVVIVNERFARIYFSNEDPIGRQIRLENRNAVGTGSSVNDLRPADVLQVVGVVKDSRQIASRQVRDLYDPVSPEIYVPFWQHPDGVHEMAVLMRSEKDPETFGDAARREVLGMDREQPIYDVQTLQALADVALGPARLCLLVLGIFAGTALLTACIGLYAIVSYSVTQRTHEIGIRVALGAKRSEVLRLVAADAMPVIGLGLGVGLLTSLGITRFMSSLLYGIPPNDLATLLGAALILTATATLAVYVPSRRAVSIDPMEALRYE